MKRLSTLLLAYSLSILPGFCTTIAYDGTHIACDSQMTHGHKKMWCKGKFKRSDARHATLCGGGDVDVLDKIEAYWTKTDKPLADMKLDIHVSPTTVTFQLLVVQDDGIALFYEDDLTAPVIVEAPFAFGSGGDFALGAMTAGADAADAIGVAEDLDLYTGGTIHVIRAPQKSVAANPVDTK